MTKQILSCTFVLTALATLGCKKPASEPPAQIAQPVAAAPAPKPSAPAEKPSLLKVEAFKDTAPAMYRAKFTTTKGDFVVEVKREWAPQGADRFYNLVKNGKIGRAHV
jgi:peptidyl-prolyl cis-trans isomerase A (cyclophilin A)